MTSVQRPVLRTGGAIWMAIPFAVLALLPGCAATAGREGLNVAELPAQVRPDYTVFAQKCSKCHPLARALNSGITDQTVWINYVARMRRQPGSGISREDTVPILRFLRYYSVDQKRRKLEQDEAGDGSTPSPDSRRQTAHVQGRDG